MAAKARQKRSGPVYTAIQIVLTDVGIRITKTWEPVGPLNGRAASLKESWLQPLLKDFVKDTTGGSEFVSIWEERFGAERAKDIR